MLNLVIMAPSLWNPSPCFFEFHDFNTLKNTNSLFCRMTIDLVFHYYIQIMNQVMALATCHLIARVIISLKQEVGDSFIHQIFIK
jgi:hypothetical protein